MPTTGRLVTSTSERITLEGSKKSRKVSPGDLILSNSMTFGQPYVMAIEGYIHDGWFVLRDYEEKMDRDFLCNLLISPIIQKQYYRLAAGGVVQNISSDLVNQVRFSLPSIAEQLQISHLLNILDERIALQSKLIEDLKKLKSAITELLFNNDASKVRLGTLIKQVSARNRDGLINIVMSVSNKHGFIAQSEQFEDRTVASEDTTNYKVIKSGIFAYNPARINVGSIAQYKGDETCIVSPMYLCFKCGVDVIGDYLEHFFSTKYFFKEMDKRLEGSVRQCLSFEALCNIPIPLPSIEQQHCTATIIGGISKMIAAESKILQAYTKQKNYLLSTMFI